MSEIKKSPKKYKSRNKTASKIVDRLYIGSCEDSKDEDFFKTKNIRAVLNCSKGVPHTFCSNSEIEYMRIPVNDSLKEADFDKMFLLLPVSVEFIHKHVDILKNNMLVNCQAGSQRSTCVVAAYLMAKRGYTLRDACELIYEKRPEAFSYGEKINFLKTLNKFSKEIKKGSTPLRSPRS